MAIDALVRPFLSLPLFRGLKPLQITEIVRRADRIVYKPGDAIIREDEAGDAAIVIISGDVARLNGDDFTSADPIPEGAMIGELAMLVETIHTSTVVARSTVRALRLTRTEMQRLMLEDPQLADYWSKQISVRLKRLAMELRAIDTALAEVANFGHVEQGRAVTANTQALLH